MSYRTPRNPDHCGLSNRIPRRSAASGVAVRPGAARADARTADAAPAAPPAAAPRAASLPPFDLLWRQAAATAAASAVLGPLCDGLHGSAGVLTYAHPTWVVSLDAGPVHWGIATCWWVLPLFGLAGLILGVGVPVLDELLNPPADVSPDGSGGTGGGGAAAPGWPAVLLCISCFVLQYYWSGDLQHALLSDGGGSSFTSSIAAATTAALDSGGGDAAAAGAAGHSTWPGADLLLSAVAFAMWAAFDRTRQGAFMAALTGVCGPAVEIFLINALHLYSYSAPQIWGVPTWIAPVYAAGGPAVGGLGRRVWAELKEQRRRQQQQQQQQVERKGQR